MQHSTRFCYFCFPNVNTPHVFATFLQTITKNKVRSSKHNVSGCHRSQHDKKTQWFYSCFCGKLVKSLECWHLENKSSKNAWSVALSEMEKCNTTSVLATFFKITNTPMVLPGLFAARPTVTITIIIIISTISIIIIIVIITVIIPSPYIYKLPINRPRRPSCYSMRNGGLPWYSHRNSKKHEGRPSCNHTFRYCWG